MSLSWGGAVPAALPACSIAQLRTISGGAATLTGKPPAISSTSPWILAAVPFTLTAWTNGLSLGCELRIEAHSRNASAIADRSRAPLAGRRMKGTGRASGSAPPPRHPSDRC